MCFQESCDEQPYWEVEDGHRGNALDEPGGGFCWEAGVKGAETGDRDIMV